MERKNPLREMLGGEKFLREVDEEVERVFSSGDAVHQLRIILSSCSGQISPEPEDGAERSSTELRSILLGESELSTDGSGSNANRLVLHLLRRAGFRDTTILPSHVYGASQLLSRLTPHEQWALAKQCLGPECGHNGSIDQAIADAEARIGIAMKLLAEEIVEFNDTLSRFEESADDAVLDSDMIDE